MVKIIGFLFVLVLGFFVLRNSFPPPPPPPPPPPQKIVYTNHFFIIFDQTVYGAKEQTSYEKAVNQFLDEFRHLPDESVVTIFPIRNIAYNANDLFSYKLSRDKHSPKWNQLRNDLLLSASDKINQKLISGWKESHNEENINIRESCLSGVLSEVSDIASTLASTPQTKTTLVIISDFIEECTNHSNFKSNLTDKNKTPFDVLSSMKIDLSCFNTIHCITLKSEVTAGSNLKVKLNNTWKTLFKTWGYDRKVFFAYESFPRNIFAKKLE